MRLYEMLMAKLGTAEDQLLGGCYTKFCKMLRQAECFEMSADVAQACTTVMSSRPTSLVTALPLTRLPYQYTWVEFSERRPGTDNGKEVPDRMGCLLAGMEDNLQKGTAYFVWNHTTYGLNLCPLALAFDWTDGAEPVYEQIWKLSPKALDKDEWFKRFSTTEGVAAILSDTNLSERWNNFLKDPREREALIALEKRALIIANHTCLEVLNSGLLTKDHMKSFSDDLSGELPFMNAFLIMLNSRHILDRKKDDYTRLNKARSKQRKTPLREFTITRLSLSKAQANRAKSAGITDREKARMTLVRGHFKLRKTGVYWWSPHPRGSGSRLVRDHYKA